LESRKTSASNRVSAVLLFTTVVLAPLLFGSTDKTVVAAWCVVLGAAVALASPRRLSRAQLIPLAVLAVLLVAYLLVLHEQLANRSWSGVAPNSIWDDAAHLLHVPLAQSISVVRDEAFLAVGAPLAAMLAFASSYLICNDRHRADQLLRVVAWSGACYAVLGIILFVIDPTRILWREKTAYMSSLTATFINRNTAAVYFGSCSVVCFLLLQQGLNSQVHATGLTVKQVLTSAVVHLRRDLVQPFFMLLVCVTAMLMTGSRAGVVFSLIGLIVAFVAFYRRRWARARSLFVALAVASAVALVLLQTFGGGVGNRFNENGISDSARLETYRSTSRMIADNPWFGTGLGSFEWSFPAYRSGDSSIWGRWTRTHNTLLEIAAELGVPMAVLVAAVWSLVLWRLWRGLRLRKRSVAVLAAAFSVAIISLLHSSIDFSLQIPGYAIVVFSMIGAGIAQSYAGVQKRQSLR
jgi:O-antigen ligase